MKKIKYLFLLIFITFISISNVNASTSLSGYEEAGITVLPNSCSSNLLKFEFTNIIYANRKFFKLDDSELQGTTSEWASNNYFIEVKPSTTYYFYNYTSKSIINVKIYYVTEDFTISSNANSTQLNETSSFVTLSDTKYILFTNYAKPSVTLTYLDSFMISESEGLSSYIPYEECAINPEEPEQPEQPEIPTTDSTLDDFYNIFNSKLKLLASYTLENKFFFSAIGVVVLFSVLGIFLKIFRIGGRR